MSEENISQEVRLKNIDETRNYSTEEINKNESISKKYQNVYRNFNYIEHLLILISIVTGCVSIFAFAFLILIGITSFAIGLEICAKTTGIKKYKSIIKKKKKKHDRVLSLENLN